jgi:hypothetical protein
LIPFCEKSLRFLIQKLLEYAICGLHYIGEIKQQLSKSLNSHRSDGNCKSDLPLSRHLRDISQTVGFPESQEWWFFEDVAQLWVFLYGCPVLTNDVG